MHRSHFHIVSTIALSLSLASCNQLKNDNSNTAANTQANDQRTGPDSDTQKSGVTPTTGLDPGKLIISSTTGETNGADIPTITFDLVKDVTSFAQDRVNNNPGTLSISTNGMNLLATDQIQILSSLGGSLSMQPEVLSDSKVKGSMDPNGFVVRNGYPMLDHGHLQFDLATSTTTINGCINIGDLALNGIKGLAMDGCYDLYKDGGLWRGKMTGKLSKDQDSADFIYDYDSPILTKIEVIALARDGHTTLPKIIQGGTARVRLYVNSNAPVNWVNYMWNSPTSNLLGGGNGTTYETRATCTYAEFAQPRSTFCEHSLGFWTWWNDYEISEYQPSGTYSWDFSVENAAKLTSRTSHLSLEVDNSAVAAATKPTVVEIRLTPSPGLSTGSGGNLKFEILAQSDAPVNWINVTLNGPTSNVFGGGHGTNFTECSTFNGANRPSICGNYGSNYWYYTYTNSYSSFQENGTYTYSGISVKNAADLTSDPYSATTTFVIAGNPVATVPIISSASVYKVPSYGADPLTQGTDITGTCLTAASLPDPLIIALVLNVTSSNAPISWLDRAFEGPTNNLEGGGSGAATTDLSGGNWRVVHYNSVASPTFAPKGPYYYHNLDVKNEGNKTSNTIGGTSLGFTLATTCPP